MESIRRRYLVNHRKHLKERRERTQNNPFDINLSLSLSFTERPWRLWSFLFLAKEATLSAKFAFAIVHIPGDALTVFSSRFNSNWEKEPTALHWKSTCFVMYSIEMPCVSSGSHGPYSRASLSTACTSLKLRQAREATQICTRQIAQTEWLSANSLRVRVGRTWRSEDLGYFEEFFQPVLYFFLGENKSISDIKC